MKRILVPLFALAALLAPSFEAGAAFDAEANVVKQGDIPDDLYVTGRNVRVDARAAGDVLAAGAQVQIEREVGGDVTAAGGQVDIDARVADDVRAFGGQLRIGGHIGGDAIGAGGMVRLLPGAKVGGRGWFAGRNVDIDGDVAGEVRAMAGSVTISGHITGDVYVRANDLRLLPSARIEGNLRHQGPKPPQVEAGAVISGDIDHEVVQRPMMPSREMARGMTGEERAFTGGQDGGATRALPGDNAPGTTAPGLDDGTPAATQGPGGWWGATALAVLTLLVAAFVYYLVFPRFATSAAALIGERPLATFALGVALLLAIPPVAVLLLVTAVGAPVGMVIALLYPVLLLLGFLTGVMFLCYLLVRALSTRHEGARWLLFTLIPAFLVLWLLYRFVPGIGALLSLLALVFGTGAIAMQALRARNTTQGETGARIADELRTWTRREPRPVTTRVVERDIDRTIDRGPPRDADGNLIERPH